MTSKEYIKAKLEYLIRYEPSLSFDIDMFEQVLKDLERLGVLDKLVTDDCIAGNEVGLQIVNNLIERSNNYRDENKQLKERLEKLENENKELEEMLSVANYVGCGEAEKVFDLTQENEKLKQKVEDLENNQETVLTTLEISVQQNLILEKAIKILKEKAVNVAKLLVSFKTDNKLDYYNEGLFSFRLTQEEYDLLKEVLGNE